MKRDRFEEIVDKHKMKIFNYLLKLLQNREEAEDLLQEVFVSFWKRMNSINEKTYLAYLYKTAYHKSLNRIKKLKKNKEFSVAEFYDPAIKQTQTNNNQELNELISKAMSKLKSKESILIEMQFYQKMSYKEIAEQLETTVSAVDSKLFRAKRKLKKIILQEKQNSVVFD